MENWFVAYFEIFCGYLQGISGYLRVFAGI